MVGRDVDAEFPERHSQPGQVVLQLQRVSSTNAGIADISLDVRQGEVLGLAGLVGSGRTELAESIFGLRSIDAGQVFIGGVARRIRSPQDAVHLGLAYVPEDRTRHGVVGPMSVASNATLASLAQVSQFGLIQPRQERQAAEEQINQLGIKTPSTLAPVSSLSGGNQQKVALSRWLLARPTLLILDEATQGVDVGARADIHRLIGRLADQGLAIILISSDLPEVLGMSDRIAVMRRGRLVGILTRDQAMPERVLALALGAEDWEQSA
jgi:rhamnose transport system ATP-binding protein